MIFSHACIDMYVCISFDSFDEQLFEISINA